MRRVGAKRRIGFADAAEGATLLYTEKYDPGGDEVNAQQRNLDILKAIGVDSQDTAMYMPVTDDDREFAARFMREAGLDGQESGRILPRNHVGQQTLDPGGLVAGRRSALGTSRRQVR